MSDYLFVVLHFPRVDKSASRVSPAELDMFVGRDFVVTLPNAPLPTVSYLFERCRINDEARDSETCPRTWLPALQDQ